MAVKIIIDPGHGGYDNGAVYNGRTEKNDNLNLALAVGDILSGLGYEVVYTRTTDVYDSPSEKAQIGNESGADYFISFHRNAATYPNQYNGVQTLVYNSYGIAYEMANNINDALAELGYNNINVEERKNLAVLRKTSMPAILIETGFIDSDYDNYLFDYKFEETAAAIAEAINVTLKNAG
jgi:N-acetylmuramoyl-L-alanine amidase